MKKTLFHVSSLIHTVEGDCCICILLIYNAEAVVLYPLHPDLTDSGTHNTPHTVKGVTSVGWSFYSAHIIQGIIAPPISVIVGDHPSDCFFERPKIRRLRALPRQSRWESSNPDQTWLCWHNFKSLVSSMEACLC